MIEVMTYEDWEREYHKRSQKAKEERKQALTQRIMGLALIICSVILCVAFSEDATPILFLFPLGVYLLITKNEIIGGKL